MLLRGIINIYTVTDVIKLEPQILKSSCESFGIAEEVCDIISEVLVFNLSPETAAGIDEK